MPYPLGMYLYRIEDGSELGMKITEPDFTMSRISPFGQICLRTFKVVKSTPCGGWVQEVTFFHHWDRWDRTNMVVTESLFEGRKFVSQGNGKRLCYPTIELATQSYRRRKTIHINKLEWSLKRARAGKELVERNDFVSILKNHLSRS